MESKDEYKQLVKPLNDKSRKTAKVGSITVVPHKFTSAGVLPETPQEIIFSKLNLNDLRFLSIWKETEYSENVDLVAKKARLSSDEATRLIKKLAWIKEEAAEVKALADIPTVSWIKAKHVKSIYGSKENKLADSDQKSLAELAKIEGAYKQQAPTTQINVFNLPALPPEQEAKLKEVFDTLATEEKHVA